MPEFSVTPLRLVRPGTGHLPNVVSEHSGVRKSGKERLHPPPYLNSVTAHLPNTAPV